MFEAVCVPSGPVIVTVALPAAAVGGTSNVICVGETKASGAGVVTPFASVTFTVVPPKPPGNGPMISPASTEGKLCPNAKASPPGAIVGTLSDAAESTSGTFAIGVVPTGANATPRNTSLALAVRMVVKV